MKINNRAERIEELTESGLQQESNVVKLDLITGGKGPPSDFWLWDFDVGTVFLSRRKNQSVEAARDFTLGEFVVYNKVEDKHIKAVLLLVNEGTGQPRPLWVDAIRFSNQMELLTVVRTKAFREVNEEEEIKVEEEISDGTDLRTV